MFYRLNHNQNNGLNLFEKRKYNNKRVITFLSKRVGIVYRSNGKRSKKFIEFACFMKKAICYNKAYKLRSGRKILHVSHPKSKLCRNVKNSAMPFTTQEEAEIFSEYHRTRSETLTHKWFCRVLHESSL